MPSLNPDTFARHTGGGITREQRAYLIAKCIEAGISDGINKGEVEAWLYDAYDIIVGDVGDLTEEQFECVLEEEGWEG